MLGSYAAVVWKQPELVIRSNRSMRRVRSRSIAPQWTDGEKGAGDAALGLVATSCFQSVGRDAALGWGTW